MGAHELGHAVHMLCIKGSFQDFDDLPLDVQELPSTLAETIVMQPGIVSQLARHYASGGPPPDALVRACQRDANFFVSYLQNSSVALGLHGEDFDPHAASPADLRAVAVQSWQRYSAVEASPVFTPLGDDAGLHVGHGANHIAYLLCYLRVDAILHGTTAGTTAGKQREASLRWLSSDFAGRVRSQLLDRVFPGQRLASLIPPLNHASDVERPSSAQAPPHPLPQVPTATASLLQRAARVTMAAT